MKAALLLALSLLLTSLALGQSPELRARAALMKANEHYAEKKFASAIDAFTRSKEYAGQSTAEIEYLLTKCHVELGDWASAGRSLSYYFELAHETDIHFNEMLLMIENIREMKMTQPTKKWDELTEDQLWNKVVETRDSTLAFYYLKKFPDGALREDICRVLTPFDTPPSISARMYTRYPEKAMREKVETQTHTAVLIDAKGLVKKIEHLRVHPYFPIVVEDAIRSSGFSPARLNGKSVRGWMVVSLKFSLE